MKLLVRDRQPPARRIVAATNKASDNRNSNTHQNIGQIDRLFSAMITIPVLALTLRQAVAALVRFYFPAIWYIPDTLILMSLPICLVAFRKRSDLAIIVALIFFANVLRSFVVYPFPYVLISVRQFLYTALPMAAGYLLAKSSRSLTALMALVAVLSVIGVFVDHLLPTPWANAQFEGLTGTAAISKTWWAGGEGDRRLAGFGIASTETCIVIAVSVTMLLFSTYRNAKIFGFLLIVPATWAIVLTTQKATAAWFVMLVLLRVGLSGNREAKVMARYRTLRAAVVTGLIFSVLAPTLFVILSPNAILESRAPTLYERLALVWPEVWQQLFSHPLAFLSGFGFGGPFFGYQEGLELVDNMFLLSCCLFGVPCALALILFLVAAARAPTGSMTAKMPFLAGMALLTLNGITANMLAVGSAGSILFGLCAGGVVKLGWGSVGRDRSPAQDRRLGTIKRFRPAHNPRALNSLSERFSH